MQVSSDKTRPVEGFRPIDSRKAQPFSPSCVDCDFHIRGWWFRNPPKKWQPPGMYGQPVGKINGTTYQPLPTNHLRQADVDGSWLRAGVRKLRKREVREGGCIVPRENRKKRCPNKNNCHFLSARKVCRKKSGETRKVHGKICLDDFCLFSDVVHWVRDFEELPLRLWIATLNFVNGGLPWMDVFRWLFFSSQTWKHNMVICAMATMNKSAIWISFCTK